MGCGGQGHGRFSALSVNTQNIGQLCEHKVPIDVCTRCDPKKADAFKKVGDWCTPHKVPESQCFPCHPELSFKPLPEAPKDADVQELTIVDQVEDLASIVVLGKVTIIKFWAIWCVPSRKTQGDLNVLLTHN